MTLTHRLTFARDGPKVMTVTDSKKLPYTFEVGMCVTGPDGLGAFVTSVVEQEPALGVAFGMNHEWWVSLCVTADIDHPGTRGLLLQQYREASGHARACVTFYTDSDGDDDGPCFTGTWGVDSAEDPDRNIIVGEGESEGAAILDALTRLAASKAAAAEDAAGLVRVSDTPADVRLDRIESMLMTLADRMTRLEEWTAAP